MTDAMNDIYFEPQEGQLCAQHALNNLLQGEYFSAVDLAQIARDLDKAEMEALQQGLTPADAFEIERTFNAEERESNNYDDSGFFSIQVIDAALQVWNLSVIPIGSSDPVAKRAKDIPEEETAFILNLAEHWFTLRRFGGSINRWYNLNSVHAEPEHVSKTYLAMLLQQMENEGYSIFVISGLEAISDTKADFYCRQVPIPPKECLKKKVLQSKKSRSSDDDLDKALRLSMGTGDDDEELKAAIEASIMDHGSDNKSMAQAISASLRDSNTAPRLSASTNVPEKRAAESAPPMLSQEEIRRKRLERFNK